MTERRLLAVVAATGSALATWSGATALITTQVSDTLPLVSALSGATGAALVAWVGAYRVAMYERTTIGAQDIVTRPPAGG